MSGTIDNFPQMMPHSHRLLAPETAKKINAADGSTALTPDDSSFTKELVRNNLLALKKKVADLGDDESGQQRMMETLIERLEGANKTSRILNCKKFKKEDIVENEADQDLLHYIVLNAYVCPVIQKGPSCGLAALSMAFHMLFPGCKNDEFEVDNILEVARSLGYTKQGEMFSVKNILDLTLNISQDVKGEIIDNHVAITEKIKLILEAIFAHQPILVPYDKDFNNEPCIKRGTKAHWSLITGMLIAETKYNEDLTNLCSRSANEGHVFFLPGNENYSKESSYINFKDEIINGDSQDSRELFIFAVQGKSLKPHLWNLSKLLRSNNQLYEIDPMILKCSNQYCLPKDGIQKALSGKMLILKRKING